MKNIWHVTENELPQKSDYYIVWIGSRTLDGRIKGYATEGYWDQTTLTWRGVEAYEDAKYDTDVIELHPDWWRPFPDAP
jgi:hypothetical protein